MIDILYGKERRFYIQTNYSKEKETKVFWPDSMVDDYLHRSTEDVFINICFYEYMSKFMKVC